MATITTTNTIYDRPGDFPNSNDSIFSKSNNGFFTANTHSMGTRTVHWLDDLDILTIKRQYANIEQLKQSGLSNSAEDISQIDRSPYPFDIFDQVPNEIDDYDIPYDESSSFDYSVIIQERLRKANEEFSLDPTSTEIKQTRVSFHTVVKAIDFIQSPDEHDTMSMLARTTVSSEADEQHSTHEEASTHEYTIPLNDTLPKGPTLLEQIKAMQLHNALPDKDRWATNPTHHNNENGLNSENNANSNLLNKKTDNARNSDRTENKTMLVTVNGKFDLRNEDDYVAEHQAHSTNNESKPLNRTIFLPTPPSEPKNNKRSRPLSVRPKSSDGQQKSISISLLDKNTKAESIRPKSASTVKSNGTNSDKSSSGVDFDALLRKAAEKKRSELQEEQRKKQDAEEKRKIDLQRAKECYERWLQEKDTERRRKMEEKRYEKEQNEARQAEDEKALADLREKAFQEWLERKEKQAMIDIEFNKLKSFEDDSASAGSTSSINKKKSSNNRAFQKWLRRKYEQAQEEKRQVRLEAKRQRQLRRRSLKRFQLQKDLWLAKSFGYT